jgi:PAS domain S-box-containing protein
MTDKKRILIVDDEPDIVKLIEISLAKYGYDTISAADGQKALDLVRNKKPDLILMDIAIKGEMDGIELAKQIRYSSDIPVIYLTAYSDDEKLARVKKTQPYGYILKPFEDRELKVAIEIGLYRAEVENQLKALTEELRISTASFQNIVGNNIDGIVVIDRNKIVKFLNPAAETMFVLKTEQVIGEKFSFPVAVGEVTEIEIARSGGLGGVGEMLTVETQWESKPAYLVSIRDVTSRKKAEEEWAKTFDTISDLIFIQDKYFNITKVNKAFADAIKMKPEDVLGKKCHEVLFKRNKPCPNCIYKKPAKDRSPYILEVDDTSLGVPMLVTISPVLDDNGNIAEAIHVTKDISIIREAENKLKKQMYELEVFHKAEIGRELEMTELKKHIAELELEVTGLKGQIAELEAELIKK